MIRYKSVKEVKGIQQEEGRNNNQTRRRREDVPSKSNLSDPLAGETDGNLGKKKGGPSSGFPGNTRDVAQP